jgi:hypothetical protein
MMKPTSITEGLRRLENELQPSVITGTAQHHLGNKTSDIMLKAGSNIQPFYFCSLSFSLSSNNCLGTEQRRIF